LQTLGLERYVLRNRASESIRPLYQFHIHMGTTSSRWTTSSDRKKRENATSMPSKKFAHLGQKDPTPAGFEPTRPEANAWRIMNSSASH
jgi:hypothetical protein